MKRFLFVCALLALLTMPVLAWAQPGLPAPPKQMPLGGIELLAAAGGAYALKKLKEREK